MEKLIKILEGIDGLIPQIKLFKYLHIIISNHKMTLSIFNEGIDSECLEYIIPKVTLSDEELLIVIDDYFNKSKSITTKVEGGLLYQERKKLKKDRISYLKSSVFRKKSKSHKRAWIKKGAFYRRGIRKRLRTPYFKLLAN